MFAVVAVAALSSCNNEGTDPVLEEDASVAAVAASVIDTTAFGNANMAAWAEIADTDLPQEVLNYIADNYPDNTIHHAWVDDNGGYVVLLNNKTALRFDNTGAFVEAIENAGRKGDDNRPELTEVDIANLPAAITDYISTNYADFTIEKAGTDADGKYHVKLTSGPVLIFDADGNFVEAREARGKGGRDGDRKGDKGHADDRWTAMDIADLPAVITDYIASNYPDATIVKAGTDADGNYGVVLDSEIALIFDADGVFVEEKTYHNHNGECDGDGEGNDDGAGDDSGE